MRNYRTRWIAGLCGLAVALMAATPLAFSQAPAAAPSESAGGEMKPLAVIVFSSYDELMADVNFIGGLAGKQEASQDIEGMLMAFTQQKGLAGLDKTKPIGVVIQAGGPMGVAGVACVPVTDLNELLGVAAPFGVTSEDLGDGLLQIKTPQGPGMFAKSVNGWALLSISPDMLEGLPADPGALLADLANEYDLGVRIHMQNVPEAYRQMAVDAMSAGAKGGLSKKDDESDEDFAAREQQVDAQLGELKRFLNELDQFTFGLSIDSDQQRALVDFAYTAVAGTKLADDLAATRDAKTNFAGFIQPDAAATMSFAGKVTPADSAQLEQMIESLRAQADKAIDDEAELNSDESRATLKSAFGDFIDAIQATVQAGVIDGGATLKMTPESLTFVAGGFIGDPAKVESGLKKIVEVAKEEEDMPEVKWAAETHGDVTFHTLSKAVPEDKEEARQLFGENVEMAVGIGKQAVYFALGRDSLATVKQVIDESASKGETAVDPMQLSVALGQIMNVAKTLADEDERPQLEMVADMLTNEAAGKDHVRMNAQPIDNGVRMRIEAEEGVLKAIGMGAKQAQAAGAGS